MIKKTVYVEHEGNCPACKEQYTLVRLRRVYRTLGHGYDAIGWYCERCLEFYPDGKIILEAETTKLI